MVVMKQLFVTVSTLVAGVVVLKEHILAVSSLGGVFGGVERTDF